MLLRTTVFPCNSAPRASWPTTAAGEVCPSKLGEFCLSLQIPFFSMKGPVMHGTPRSSLILCTVVGTQEMLCRAKHLVTPVQAHAW